MTAKSSSARMLRAMLALFAASVSCHDYVPISMPPIDTAATASMILIVTDADGGFVSVFGVPLDPVPVMPVFSRPAHVRAYALAFSCPLDVIGVQEGLIHLADRASDQDPLPPPLATYAIALGPEASQAGDPHAWHRVIDDATELAQIREVVHRVPVQEDNLCKLYGSSADPAQPPFAVDRGALAHPQLMIRGDDDAALLATSDGKFYRVARDTTVEPLALPADAESSTTAFPHGAGYRDDDGSVWLVGTDGAIAHGRPTAGLETFERFDVRTSTTYAALRVDGARGGAPTEIFLVSSTGNLERFDGSDWALVSAPPTSGSSFGRTHDVLWIAPGEALATGLGEYPNQIAHYRSGYPMTVESLEPGSGRPISVARLEDYGIFVGTDTGQIAVLTDAGSDAGSGSSSGSGSSLSFRTIEVRWPESAERSRQVHVFLPGEDDVLFGMIYFARFHPIAGVCPLEFEAAPTDEVVSLSGGIHLLRPFPNFLDTDRWGLSALVTRPHRPSCLPAHSDASFAQVR